MGDINLSSFYLMKDEKEEYENVYHCPECDLNVLEETDIILPEPKHIKLEKKICKSCMEILFYENFNDDGS